MRSFESVAMGARDPWLGWLPPLWFLLSCTVIGILLIKASNQKHHDSPNSEGSLEIRNVALVGPKIIATMSSGFCGENDILVSRLPVDIAKQTTWSILLATLHEHSTKVGIQGDRLVADREQWTKVPSQPLLVQGVITGISIARTTFINLLLLSNARPTYIYADASGYRAGFGSWIGQWYVNWPMNGPAVVLLRPHDSHTPSTDVYPPTFKARMDCCVQMMAGIVVLRSNPKAFNLGFPGRSEPGVWRLEHQPKGFAGSHGSRHIYNMNGGKVYEVDFLFMERVSEHEPTPNNCLQLRLPSLVDARETLLYVPEKEQEVLAQAMDYLPWASLSWSIHRGLRDLLVAFSKPIMDRYRHMLAKELQRAAAKYHDQLVVIGWDSDFVESHMGDMAASAVLAGRGNSGDLVRIVTCLAEISSKGEVSKFDETNFWKNRGLSPNPQQTLDPEAIIALVKCFVLEWSVDFDYQMYHELPIDMIMV